MTENALTEPSQEMLLAEHCGWGGGEGMEFVFQKHYTGKKHNILQMHKLRYIKAAFLVSDVHKAFWE